MKAEKRQIPQPPPPPPSHVVILTLSEEEARVLMWLSGWEVTIPRVLEEHGAFSFTGPKPTSREALPLFMKDLRAALNTVIQSCA